MVSLLLSAVRDGISVLELSISFFLVPTLTFCRLLIGLIASLCPDATYGRWAMFFFLRLFSKASQMRRFFSLARIEFLFILKALEAYLGGYRLLLFPPYVFCVCQRISSKAISRKATF